MTLRALIASVIAALVLGLGLEAGTNGSSSFFIVGIDLEVSDNTPRSIADFDDCASVGVGETISIDVGLGEPGVPDDRGLAGYQFRLFYDPQVFTLIEDDYEMLLDQAEGSNIVPLADPKPDDDGIYLSSGVDFGSAGIEPEGTSEVGAGVLSRVTLESKAAGTSGLVLQDVVLKDDSAEDIEVDSVQSAQVYVGQSCPGFESTPTPTLQPTAAPSTPSPGPSPGSGSGEDVEDTGGQAGSGNTPVSSDPAEMVTAGGPPDTERTGYGFAIILSGALLATVGVALTLGGMRRRDRP